jgi:hypothetical protein
MSELSREAVFSKYMKNLRDEKKELDIWLGQVKRRLSTNTKKTKTVHQENQENSKENSKEEDEKSIPSDEENEEEVEDIESQMNQEAVETIQRYETKIAIIEHRLRTSSKEEGEDELFETYFQKMYKSHIRQQTKEIRKKQEHDRIDAENKAIGQSIFEKDRKQRSDDRHLESQTKRELDYFLKMDDSVPDYIQRNLNNMSNNRGYIWRGVHYYGHRQLSHQDDPATTYIQERRKGENYLIEDTYQKVKRVFLKGPKGSPFEIVEEVYFS